MVRLQRRAAFRCATWRDGTHDRAQKIVTTIDTCNMRFIYILHCSLYESAAKLILFVSEHVNKRERGDNDDLVADGHGYRDGHGGHDRIYSRACSGVRSFVIARLNGWPMWDEPL